MIAAMLGHALVATEDPKNFDEAKQVLKVAVNRDNEDPFAWYQLGIIYDREGDQSRGDAGDRRAQQPRGQSEVCLASAQTAMKGIPTGNAGLSSRAGYRHGVAGRAGEERQEIPGSERPVNEATAAPRRGGTFGAAIAGGIIGSLLDRGAAVLRSAQYLQQQDRPPGIARRPQDPDRRRRCASRRAI